jgi:predicted aspartyl protease
MPSFTTQVPNLRDIGPIVQVRMTIGTILEDVMRRNGSAVPVPLTIPALIDTGATGTVIRQDLIPQLNLHPVGTTLIHTPSSINVVCYEYLMRIIFPNNVVVETVVIGAPLQGQNISCLIGRDVLQQGVFIYTGYTNTFTLSF